MAATEEELALRIVTEGMRQFLADMGKADSAVGGSAAKCQKAGGIIGKTVSAALGIVATGAAAAGVAAIGLGVAIGKMTLDAAQVQGVVNTFDALVESIGGDATLAMEQLRVATRGMVADADLMQAGNKFLAMGLANTTEEAANLAEVATQLGMAMGEDATSSMENFALMMANQSLPRLDSFGISSGKVRERITELMAETQGLSREQAFNTAVMEQAAVTMARVGEQSGTAGASMATIRAQIKNITLYIGQAFLPVLSALLKPLARLIQEHGPQLVAVFEKVAAAIIPVVEEFANFLGRLLDGEDPLTAFKVLLMNLVPPKLFSQIMEIADGVAEFVDIITDVIAAFTSGTPGDFPWEDILPPKMADIAYKIADGIDTITDIISNVELQDALIGLGAALAIAFGPAMVAAIGGAITAALTAISGIIAAAAPVIAVLLAVTAAAALLRQAWETDFGGIRTFLTDFWNDTAQPILTELWQWLQINIPLALETLRAWWVDVAWPAIQGATETAGEIISGIFNSITSFINDTLIPTAEGLRDKWLEIWGTIQTVTNNVKDVLAAIFQEIGRWINDNIVPWLEYLKEIWVDTVWPAIQEALAAAWAVIEPIWEAIRVWIAETMPPILEEMQKFFEDTWTAIQEALAAAWAIIEPIWEAIEEWATIKLKEALEGLRIIFENVMGAIGDAITPIKEIWDSFVDAIKKFWNWISSHKFEFKIHLPDLPSWAKPPGGRGGGGGGWQHGGTTAGGPMLVGEGGPELLTGVPGGAQVLSAPTTARMLGGGSSVTNNYNLTTNSLTRPSGLRLEFAAMEMGSR